MLFWWEYIIIIVLILLSGLFSGLTLGLLSLNPMNLNIIMSGETKEALYARYILPIRKKGNWLLCTLLIGNVLVNNSLAIFLGDATSGILGLIISTLMIVIFGEIIPQSVCSRYSLLVGYHTRWITKGLLLLLSPISWPLSWILDKVMGEEIPSTYTNTELKKLVEIYEKDKNVELQSKVANIMTGALNLDGKCVGDLGLMVPWDDVYKISMNTLLNFEILSDFFGKGYSRIPIYSDMDYNKDEIVGIVFVKELILLDPEDEIPVSSIINTFEHPILKVSTDFKLSDMLTEFCSGKGHIAIVKEKMDNNMGLYSEKNVGIITLEDIIEFIFNIDIIDETDIVLKNRERNFDMSKLKLFDYRPKRPNNIAPEEIKAVIHHLKGTFSLFRNIPDNNIENIINNSKVIDVFCENKTEHGIGYQTVLPGLHRSPCELIENNGLMLYEKDEITEYMSVILDGKVEIHSGMHNFLSEVSRWFVLCQKVLDITYKSCKNNTPLEDYKVDFSAKVVSNSRILRISKNIFHNEINKIKNISNKIEIAVI